MKKFRISLLWQVLIAIATGIALGQFLPVPVARIFVTFNGLFGNFLTFAIPLIIIGLIIPAISDLGKGAGRLLLVTPSPTVPPYFRDSSPISVEELFSRN